MKGNLRAHLNNIDIKEKDGSITNLGENMEEKRKLEKNLQARKEHTDAWIRENSLRITETLTELPEYRNAERIMAYADYNHEVITRYIIEQAWKTVRKWQCQRFSGRIWYFTD